MVRPLCSADLYSHPEVLLIDHLRAVATQCAAGGPTSTKKLRYIVGACHDFGKATGFFQEYLFEKRPQSQQTNHSTISGLACFYALRAAGFTPIECVMGWLAVTRHHSPLINTGGEDGVFDRVFYDTMAPINVYDEQARDLAHRADVVQSMYNSLSVPLDVADFCEWVIKKGYVRDISSAVGYTGSLAEQSFDSAIRVIELFSQLVAADKLCAAGYDLHERSPLPADAVETYVHDIFGEPEAESIDALREQARREIVDRIAAFDDLPLLLSLTLPTGLGKTFTGFDAALRIRHRKPVDDGSPRIIYALPFTAIIDQNFTEFERVLNHAGLPTGPETMLKHHYRSKDDFFATESKKDTETDAEFWRHLMLTDRWESEIVTTTFVQLLESLVVPSNRQSIKLPNLRDAIIILDEVQSIPVEYWDVIQETCRQLASDWNCTIIAMTATQPGLFDDVTPLISDPSIYFDPLNRVTFSIHPSVDGEAGPLSYDTLTERVVDVASETPRQDILVICNTVDAARTLYKRVATRTEIDDEVRLEYLSSAVRPCDRTARIQSLSQEIEEQRIVVSTQVIEAGVDLSFDHVVRDFAPLDSLVQAAGRCNRHSVSGGGNVEIVQLVDDDGTVPTNVIYDSPRLDATRRVISSLIEDGRALPEPIVTNDAVQCYFDELANVKVTDSSVSALRWWDFEDARITLIPETHSVDAFVVSETTTAADLEILDAYESAITAGEQSEARQLRPEFYDRVVSVSLYAPDSSRAKAMSRLPYVDTLEIYRVPAHQSQYSDWYSQQTGFELQSSTVDSRLI